MRAIAGVLGLAAAGMIAATAHAAKPHTTDHVWTHPEFTRFTVKSVAMLPVATFDRSIDAEKQVQNAWGQAFAATGYRWVSATTVRDLLRASEGGDSLLKVIRESVLKGDRLDSLLAPGLCARLHTDVLLSVRVDQWAQVAIEPDQAGKPSTSVQLKAALVDSTGALLWTASGSETVEGLYHEPSQGDLERSGTSGTRSTGLGGSSTAGTAPPYTDVLDRLLTRWAKLFPAKPAPAPPPK